MQSRQPSHATRRTVLAGLATVPFAGCSRLRQGPPRPDEKTLPLSVWNLFEEPVELHVSVTQAGTELYDETHPLDPREGNQADTATAAVTVATDSPYRLRASDDDGHAADHEFEYAEAREGLTVIVEEDGSLSLLSDL
jgi:hypothetical protein